ncbi:TIGR03067 domain-containing protein [bacterium]|nr:TIGR03067 domain-containing protein [bacterium]
MRAVCVAVGAAALMLGSAGPSGADDATKKEFARLQGEWQLIRAEKAGKVYPAEQAKIWFAVKDDQFIPAADPSDPARLTLHPGKMPAQIDLVAKDQKTTPGIYRVTGDEWEICLAGADGVRPTAFKTAPENKLQLLVLKRKAK